MRIPNSPVRAQAIALVHARHDGAIVASALAAVAVFAAGWQVGGLLLHVLGLAG